MWVLYVIAMTGSGSISLTSESGFTTRNKCIAAVNFSKNRRQVYDAWCVEK